MRSRLAGPAEGKKPLGVLVPCVRGREAKGRGVARRPKLTAGKVKWIQEETGACAEYNDNHIILSFLGVMMHANWLALF